jgi:hypothetical protein
LSEIPVFRQSGRGIVLSCLPCWGLLRQAGLIFLASFFASRQRMKWACLAADRASGQSPGKAKFQEYFLFRHFLSSQKVTKED